MPTSHPYRRASRIALILLTVAVARPAVAADAWEPAGTLTFPRALHTTTVTTDGTVIVAGGRGCPASGVASLAFSAERLSPGGWWELTAPMLLPRDRHAAAALQDGRVLVVGGQFTAGVCQSRVHVPMDRPPRSTIRSQTRGPTRAPCPRRT
jgi:hypothetical protein